jgi:hypothetical protein
MHRRYLRAGPLAGLYLLLILLSGACDNPANGNDEDPAVTAAKAARDAADSFYGAHRGVITLPVDMLTLADADPVSAALEAYTGLRDHNSAGSGNHKQPGIRRLCQPCHPNPGFNATCSFNKYGH